MRTETVAVIREAGVDQRLQALHDGLLDQPVVDGGYPQQTDTAVRFGDLYPPDWLRAVVARQQSAPDVCPVGFCPVRVGVQRDAVDACAALVLPHMFPCRVQVGGQQNVVQ